MIVRSAEDARSGDGSGCPSVLVKEACRASWRANVGETGASRCSGGKGAGRWSRVREEDAAGRG